MPPLRVNVGKVCRSSSGLRTRSFPAHVSQSSPLTSNHMNLQRQSLPKRVACLKIDRRRHFDAALRRQNEEEKRLRNQLAASEKTVVEVRSLDQLEQVVETFDSSLLILFLYSRSCGSCKRVLDNYQHLCYYYGEENARVIFVKHDVHDAFDHVTDIARMYNVHAVPSFLFLSGGALIERIQFADSRHAMSNVQRRLDRDASYLKDVIRRVLFKSAPSAMT